MTKKAKENLGVVATVASIAVSATVILLYFGIQPEKSPGITLEGVIEEIDHLIGYHELKIDYDDQIDYFDRADSDDVYRVKTSKTFEARKDYVITSYEIIDEVSIASEIISAELNEDSTELKVYLTLNPEGTDWTIDSVYEGWVNLEMERVRIVEEAIVARIPDLQEQQHLPNHEYAKFSYLRLFDENDNLLGHLTLDSALEARSISRYFMLEHDESSNSYILHARKSCS